MDEIVGALYDKEYGQWAYAVCFAGINYVRIWKLENDLINREQIITAYWSYIFPGHL